MVYAIIIYLLGAGSILLAAYGATNDKEVALWSGCVLTFVFIIWLAIVAN